MEWVKVTNWVCLGKIIFTKTKELYKGGIMSLIEILTPKNIIIYLLIINLISFLSMGIDKWKAKRGAWRIPEQTLISMVLLGGGIGGILGMYVFRHKTKKPRFYIGFPVILVLEIVVAVYVLVKFWGKDIKFYVKVSNFM